MGSADGQANPLDMMQQMQAFMQDPNNQAMLKQMQQGGGVDSLIDNVSRNPMFNMMCMNACGVPAPVLAEAKNVLTGRSPLNLKTIGMVGIAGFLLASKFKPELVAPVLDMMDGVPVLSFVSGILRKNKQAVDEQLEQSQGKPKNPRNQKPQAATDDGHNHEETHGATEHHAPPPPVYKPRGIDRELVHDLFDALPHLTPQDRRLHVARFAQEALNASPETAALGTALLGAMATLGDIGKAQPKQQAAALLQFIEQQPPALQAEKALYQGIRVLLFDGQNASRGNSPVQQALLKATLQNPQEALQDLQDIANGTSRPAHYRPSTGATSVGYP